MRTQLVKAEDASAHEPRNLEIEPRFATLGAGSSHASRHSIDLAILLKCHKFNLLIR